MRDLCEGAASPQPTKRSTPAAPAYYVPFEPAPKNFLEGAAGSVRTS